jgi:hypothetical protein
VREPVIALPAVPGAGVKLAVANKPRIKADGDQPRAVTPMLVRAGEAQMIEVRVQYSDPRISIDLSLLQSTQRAKLQVGLAFDSQTSMVETDDSAGNDGWGAEQGGEQEAKGE